MTIRHRIELRNGAVSANRPAFDVLADRTEDVRLRGDQIATARWIIERPSAQ